jgi:ATP-dependent protease HslVU (ClpYQ) peptidase subunit
MTCIVGLETPDKTVIVGSDSFIGDDLKEIMDRPKYVKRGHLLIASSGNHRPGQLAEYCNVNFRGQRKNEDDLEYITMAVVEPIRKFHRSMDLTKRSCGANLLIAYHGHVYTMLDDYAVYRSGYGYMAIGAADAVALGALSATFDLPPKERVERALKAATRHHSNVARPFFIEEWG